MSTGIIHAAKPLISDEERFAVDRVLASGMLVQGPEVAAFEEEFSALVGGRHCIAANSGTSALHLGMLAAGIGPGDEVIVPSFSFAATANSVALTGATPVFADIEPDFFCLDPSAVEAAITRNTAAIMPVHLYGHPAAMDQLRTVAEHNGLAIVEDAAQAHAASLHGTPVGAFGLVRGIQLLSDQEHDNGGGRHRRNSRRRGRPKVTASAQSRDGESLRERGRGVQHAHDRHRGGDRQGTTGQTLRVDRDQAAERRDSSAGLARVVVPPVAAGAVHVHHQYTIRSQDRDGLQKQLADAGVGSGVYYPIPIHRLPSFGFSLDLPETERAAAEVLSLPVHPALTGDDVHRIVKAVNEAVTG